MRGPDRQPRHRWTEAEHELLRREYARGRAGEMRALIGVTPHALRLKVQELGLSKPRHPGGPWSAADDAALRSLCGVATAAELADKLGRTRYAVERRMAQLGLRRNEAVRRRTADHLRRLADLRALLAWKLGLLSGESAARALGIPAADLPRRAVDEAMTAAGVGGREGRG